MKTILAMALLSLFVAANATCQEPSKIKIAVVRIDRVINSEGGGYDRARMLSADKDVLDALKAINAEMKKLQKELLSVDDEIKLAEMGKRIEFLNRKCSMVRQRTNGDSGRDVQRLARQFVIDNYKGSYHLIAQDSGVFDRCLWKDNVEIVDITEEAAAKFKDYLDKTIGD